MITKTANTFMGLKTIGKEIGNDLINPLNLGFTSYYTASGMGSLGESLGMSIGGTLGSRYYNKFSDKYKPLVQGFLKKKLPGRIGTAASALVGGVDFVNKFIFPAATAGVAGSVAKKYMPLYRRKLPEPVNNQL